LFLDIYILISHKLKAVSRNSMCFCTCADALADRADALEGAYKRRSFGRSLAGGACERLLGLWLAAFACGSFAAVAVPLRAAAALSLLAA
jgi:hypothetical protein